MKKEDQVANNLIGSIYYGAWHQTGLPSRRPSETRLSIIWSGWSHVGTALKHSEPHRKSLTGERYIAFGGGDACGGFNPCCIEAITDAIKLGKLWGYDGVAYCLMEGSSGLSEVLEESFVVAHEYGMKVLVSMAAPFSFSDSDVLMNNLLESDNIDILSPQLYETGQESYNNYAIFEGRYDFSRSKAKLVPSLACAASHSLDSSTFLFWDALTYFSRHGGEIEGFILSQPPLSDSSSNEEAIASR